MLGLGQLQPLGRALLGLNQDKNRDVFRMCMRPVAHLPKALRERLTVTSVIDILNVHHLEARLGHDAIGVEGRIRGQAGRGSHRGP